MCISKPSMKLNDCIDLDLNPCSLAVQAYIFGIDGVYIWPPDFWL